LRVYTEKKFKSKKCPGLVNIFLFEISLELRM